LFINKKVVTLQSHLLLFRKMKRLLYILILMAPMVAYANGDPTATYCALTLSKAPVPRAIPEIQIERENLHVVLENGQSRIKVDYVLHNTSDLSFDTIHYGFPVDWMGDGLVHWEGDFYTEKQYQKGWSDDYVREFAFSLDGTDLPAKMSEDTILQPTYTTWDWHQEFGYPDPQKYEYDSVHHNPDDWEDRYNWIGYVSEYEWDGMPEKPWILENSLRRRWYYTSFAVAPRQTVTLHVEYVLSHSMGVGLYELGEEFQNRYESWLNNYAGGEINNTSFNQFAYDFSPAAAWGNGTTHELDITIEAPNTKVWLPDKWWRGSCLFEGSYHQHYTDFQYATALPLELAYWSYMPDSLDVNAIRDHRLSPSCYRIMQHDGDTCSYAALSDLNGCTGVSLTPTEKGNYVLDIVLQDTIPLTGLAILNGRYCDLNAWRSTPRAKKMKVTYWGTNNLGEEVERTVYGTRERGGRYIEARHHPATCKTAQPADFTWTSQVKAMEKMNLGNRDFETPYGSYVDENSHNRVYHIRIQIPLQEAAPFLSEIILLSTRSSSCK